MSIITLASILVTFCAVFSYINYTLIKLPTTIGIMVMALSTSTILMLLPLFDIDIVVPVRAIMSKIDFSETLLNGMLSFLLFAGALHVNWETLSKQKFVVTTLSIFSTVFSTALVGWFCWFLFPKLGFNIRFVDALLFGALISPTDPIAVMAILRKVGVPAALETKVVGESLFNDGVSVVIFLAVLGVAMHGQAEPSHVAMLFLEEAVGGAVLGGILGYLAFLMLRSVDNYQVEIFLTLALVMGGYQLAQYLHMSGPIAMVVAGLIVGNLGRALAMSDMTKQNLDNFWELIDEFLNAILFMLIGFELIMIPFDVNSFQAGLIMIPALLFIRYLSVKLPIAVFSRYRTFSAGAVPILVWGGLRGGISVALVLSLPSGELRDFLLLVTYCIVLFSILGQGLTIGRLARHFHGHLPPAGTYH
jgi:CPA1 family monovalent cation:H+ antiporter